MTQKARDRAVRVAGRMSPTATDRLRVLERRARGMGARLGRRGGRTRQLAARIDELEEELMQQRVLNRRIAELADVVAELLVPAVDRDEARLTALLDANAPRRPRA
jgi:uncharacterized coiled-coil protein SlyX